MEQEPEKRELRGLYRHVKISVRALDTIIISCIVVIVVVLALNLRNPGFTVSFDAKGGTDIPPQKQMYGELLALPEPPTREGYVFTGWYKDAGCFDSWNAEEDTVQGEMTLYAGWEKQEKNGP